MSEYKSYALDNVVSVKSQFLLVIPITMSPMLYLYITDNVPI